MRPSTSPRATDGMAGPMAGTVAAKGNNLGWTRFLVVSQRLFVVLMANANCILHVSPHKLSSDISRFSQ